MNSPAILFFEEDKRLACRGLLSPLHFIEPVEDLLHSKPSQELCLSGDVYQYYTSLIAGGT